MPPKKKIILTCKNVILQIYTVKATTYNIKYYNTTDSHYSGQCLSKITKVLKFLLQGFTGSSHSLAGCSPLASIITVVLLLDYNLHHVCAYVRRACVRGSHSFL